MSDGSDRSAGLRGIIATIPAHKISSDLKFRFILLHGVGKVLPDDEPIGGDSFRVRLNRSLTAVIVVKLTPEIKYASYARRQRRLREEKIRFNFISHGLLSAYDRLIVSIV